VQLSSSHLACFASYSSIAAHFAPVLAGLGFECPLQNSLIGLTTVKADLDYCSSPFQLTMSVTNDKYSISWQTSIRLEGAARLA
jgi:hypothetical protein